MLFKRKNDFNNNLAEDNRNLLRENSELKKKNEELEKELDKSYSRQAEAIEAAGKAKIEYEKMYAEAAETNAILQAELSHIRKITAEYEYKIGKLARSIRLNK